MTVKELIEHLQTLDPNTHVFTAGYEGGYEDIFAVDNTRDIALNYHTEWYYGPHVDADDVDVKENYTIVKGIIL